jgi:hypothetical protein
MKKSNNLIITILLVLSIILIFTALFFCRDSYHTYSFEVGKLWLHPRLEASFQFDIELDE